MEYYSAKLDVVLKELKTSKLGLTDSQAKQAFEKYGPNELTEGHKISPWEIFFNQFKSFVVGILIAIFFISLGMGIMEGDITKELPEAIAVLVIIIMNAVLGFVQEFKAEKAIEALKKMASPKAHVIRNGKQVEIDSRELVPGDIIVLATGDKIPADSRVVESSNLETLEAALTGESVPVSKEDIIFKEGTPVANRRNMVFSSTIVTKGHGKAVVTGTGMTTEFGKIAKMIQESSEELTPLQKKLKDLGKFVGIMSLVICAIIFVVSLFESGWKASAIGESLQQAVALAVAAIPEGLAAVVTIALALGVQRMVKRHALIRRLPSVETLGSTTVICTDKTGTLTHNEMTVKKIYANGKVVDVSGAGYKKEGQFSSDPSKFELLLRIGLLNNDAKLDGEKVMGDPTEGCLLVSAEKAGLDYHAEQKAYPRVDEIPFDSERKLMTTIHKTRKERLAFTKGAPDNILKICDRILSDGKVVALSPAAKKKIMAQNDLFSKEALRVLGFAYKELKADGKSKGRKDSKKNIEADMIFVGLQAMIDPPRAEVKDAIHKCKTAGIKVVMITGDYIGTAVAIGRELGIEGRAITGEELDRIKDLDKVVEEIGIYARVNPEHKMKIIEAFKRKGEIVAMTGDGVNDAPALKKSDIGIAMGISGTDVAKEASDVILTDDNFTSIVNAIEEGRGIYENIRNFVRYLLGCNIGEVLAVFTGVLMGFPMVLLPLQILMMNIVTDGLPALALGVEPIDPEIMSRKPRKPNEQIFPAKALLNMAFVGIIMAAGTLFMFQWVRFNTGELVKAQAMAFTTLVMFQMFYVLTTRSESTSLLKMGVFSNKYLIYAVLSSIAIQAAILYSPLDSVINGGFSHITLLDWGYILLVSCTIFVIVESKKMLFRLAEPMRTDRMKAQIAGQQAK
jgi:P-type Ca2+ transporter type 2C